VVAGKFNTADSDFVFIGGGETSIIHQVSHYSAVVGGYDHTINGGEYSFIGGGWRNQISNNDYATVVGGKLNGAGAFSFTGGGQNNASAGSASHAVVGGGYFNYVSGNWSTLGGGYDNDLRSAYGFIGGGRTNNIETFSEYAGIASGESNLVSTGHAFIGGGKGNKIWEGYSSVGGGFQNTASANYVSISGGRENTAEAQYSSIPGGYEAKTSNYGEFAHASGKFQTVGDAQTMVYVLRRTAVDANVTEMFLDGTTERMTIPNDTTWVAKIMVGGRRTDGGGTQSAGYSTECVIKNEAGTVTMLGGNQTALTPIYEEDVNWNVAVEADDTNDALVIKVTGAAAQNHAWVARVEVVQITY